MKKFLITVAGLLTILIYSPSYASERAQVANCPIDDVSYACCTNDKEWSSSRLWVLNKDEPEIDSFDVAQYICMGVNADIADLSRGECRKDTSILNQPIGDVISITCNITELRK